MSGKILIDDKSASTASIFSIALTCIKLSLRKLNMMMAKAGTISKLSYPKICKLNLISM